MPRVTATVYELAQDPEKHRTLVLADGGLIGVGLWVPEGEAPPKGTVLDVMVTW